MDRQIKLWTMRDGTKIRICDMTDLHIINTIRMLKRRAREIGSIERGNGWEYYLPDIYNNLKVEADMRGLER